MAHKIRSCNLSKRSPTSLVCTQKQHALSPTTATTTSLQCALFFTVDARVLMHSVLTSNALLAALHPRDLACSCNICTSSSTTLRWWYQCALSSDLSTHCCWCTLCAVVNPCNSSAAVVPVYMHVLNQRTRRMLLEYI
jgi:hypothetical protein